MNTNREIQSDIDQTLDQLIANAKAMEIAAHSHELMNELQALQKTQESLLSRLIDRQKQLGKKPPTLQTQEKMTSLANQHKQLTKAFNTLRRRRLKRSQQIFSKEF